MTAGDLINDLRIKIAEPNTNRWTDSYLLQIATDATNDIALDVDFPEASYVIYTVAGQREYPMIENIKVLRVYLEVPTVSQTPLPGSDIPTLEGDILMTYDQSSSTVTGQVGFSPQFIAEAAQAYPLGNSDPTGVVASALPYSSVTASGQRGTYYLRGGSIGVVPPPVYGSGVQGSSWWIVVDHIPIQPTFANDTNLSIYPRFYINAIVARMAEICYNADKSAMADVMKAEYQEQVYKLRSWLYNRQATKPKRFVPLTKRTFTNAEDTVDGIG